MPAGCLLSLVLVACGADVPQASAVEEGDGNGNAFRQWKLPGRLREISGLALAPDERLFAITDERAIVYELDYADGSIIKSFSLGDPVVRGDFEGIAVLDELIWLLTSDGLLYATADGPDGSHMTYGKFDTGLGDVCELEGLGANRQAGTLLLACKEMNRKKDGLMIFELGVSERDIVQRRSVALPEKAIEASIDEKNIHPSGITIDPQSGEWLLIAARQDALVRLSADGSLADAIILPKKGRHRQAEGIEMTRDGRLLLADEGGDGRARLAVYAAAPRGR